MSNPALAEITSSPDYEAIKTKQQAIWGSGDYGRIGVTVQQTGENLLEAMDVRAGQTVLDVAAGNGNASLAAARRFCKVVSTDYVSTLLEQSETRARAEGLAIDYKIADAENLPFSDHQFDNVVSTFGVMFAPNQARAASELLRVCRKGGKIGMTNWTPAGFIGDLFKSIGQFVPPPAGVHSPALWGSRNFIQSQFGSATDISIEQKTFAFRYQSADHWLDLFRTYYGPVHKAFQALNDERSDELANTILELIAQRNVAVDGTMVVHSEFLEITITR